MRSEAFAMGRWPGILVDPGLALSVDLAGLPGLFQAPNRWVTPGHALAEHLVYAVVKGPVEFEGGEEPVVLEPGAIAWVTFGTPFRFRQMVAKRSVTLVRFRIATAARPSWQARCLPNGWALFPVLHRIVEAAHQTTGSADLRRRAGLALLAEALEGTEGPAGSTGAARGLTLEQRLAVERLDVAGLTPAAMARAAGLSPDYFARRFAQSYGCAPRRWLVIQRLERGAGLLRETNRRIGEIAADLGYDNAFLFTRQFTEHFGMSPRQFRVQFEVPRLKAGF